MNTAKLVMIILLTLTVAAIALFLALVSLDPAIGNSGEVTNTSTFVLIDGPGNNTIDLSIYRLPVMSTLIIWNGTNETVAVEPLSTANYTINNITGNIVSTGSEYNNTLVNVTYTWTDEGERISDWVTLNSTAGTRDFFNNMPTVFTILGAVIIILAVTLILFAVNRFSQGSGAGSFAGRSGSSGSESRL